LLAAVDDPAEKAGEAPGAGLVLIGPIGIGLRGRLGTGEHGGHVDSLTQVEPVVKKD
jgi:hypothetical protein